MPMPVIFRYYLGTDRPRQEVPTRLIRLIRPVSLDFPLPNAAFFHMQFKTSVSPPSQTL